MESSSAIFLLGVLLILYIQLCLYQSYKNNKFEHFNKGPGNCGSHFPHNCVNIQNRYRKIYARKRNSQKRKLLSLSPAVSGVECGSLSHKSLAINIYNLKLRYIITAISHLSIRVIKKTFNIHYKFHQPRRYVLDWIGVTRTNIIIKKQTKNWFRRKYVAGYSK